MYIEKLKQMFKSVTLDKNAESIHDYYHKECLLFTNNQVLNFETFIDSHRQTCATGIRFEVEYEEDALLEQNEKVAARLWITTCMPNEKPHKMEVMLIATYKEGKIYRAWELTYPDWSKLPEFSDTYR